jgi:hypothetical protein
MHSFASSLDNTVIYVQHREMAERSNAAVLKTVELRGSGGSNPSLSTVLKPFQTGRVFLFVDYTIASMQYILEDTI